jgi:antitoxin (DNA-binding transcriptional repressor) of toxin-antitoxin stability system
MTVVNVNEARLHLSQLLTRVARGEQVVIADLTSGAPAAGGRQRAEPTPQGPR